MIEVRENSTVRNLMRNYKIPGRICGNRMTSRIDGELVSSITSRSMPMPFAGGRREAVFEGAYIVGVVVHRLGVARVLCFT